MKTIATRLLALGFLPSLLTVVDVRAQEGSITLSALDYTPLCYLHDSGPGIQELYVLHRFNTGTTASRFRIQTGPGSTLTYVSEEHHFATTQGNTQDGISICYGACTAGDQLLVTIRYMSYGTSASCGLMLVAPHPDAQTVEAIRCDMVPVATFVRDLFVVRVLGDCGCPIAHAFPGAPEMFDCQPVPVAISTWGAVKALYRQ